MTVPHSILFILKDGKRDDVIRFWPAPHLIEHYIVEFTPSDLTKSKYKFSLNQQELKLYIQSLLDLLRYDNEPFDDIQLTTKMIPSVIFSIADLDRTHIRGLIEYNIMNALDTPIEVERQ